MSVTKQGGQMFILRLPGGACVGDDAKHKERVHFELSCGASPIWGIGKSSVRHENESVDIREFHAALCLKENPP